MGLRKILVWLLLRLYPRAWRKEYGEEMRSMLLAQPLTASVIGDVFLNAMRQNFRRPDPWRIAVLILVAWRTSWILWASISGLSPETWAPLLPLDRGLFLVVAFATGCWTTINEGSADRGAADGFTPTVYAVNLASLVAALLLPALAPDKTIPHWADAMTDPFGNHPFDAHYGLLLILSRALASIWGALLGYVIRRAKSSLTRQPFP
jgi:hypothetical protein